MPESPRLADAAERLFRTAFPRLTITRPAEGIRVERDVTIPMRDGVPLRANVFRPARAGRFPVILSAHPYGKDALPLRAPAGYFPPARYRFMRQPDPISFSAFTSWEAPDPSYWVPFGYAVVNLDLRGFGASGGVGTLLSDQEAEDYAEAIGWAAAQPWSTGRVGLNGVSYLAITQWKVAALRPPALAAICPWEGWTDFYRDVAYPGGVREDGFVPFWAGMTERRARVTESLRAEQLRRPEHDAWWASKAPALERIEVPALLCASFSDQGLHTRGSFEAFRRIGSRDRFLYTHRGGKWSTYYSAEALEAQRRFFDRFVKEDPSARIEMPPVRLEVRASRARIHEVRREAAWPPPRVQPTPLFLAPGELRRERSRDTSPLDVDLARGAVEARFRFADDATWSGPMRLRLHLELLGCEDACLFVLLSKIDASREEAPFEGPSGFAYDVIARGWQRVAHRRRDDDADADPLRVHHPHDRAEPLRAGTIAVVDVELLPSATSFARGDAVSLRVQGRWPWRRSMLFGTYPFDYAPSPSGRARIHAGGARDTALWVPWER